MTIKSVSSALLCALALAHTAAQADARADDYDLVIRNGRVMNPANGLDSVRDVGIRSAPAPSAACSATTCASGRRWL